MVDRRNFMAAAAAAAMGGAEAAPQLAVSGGTAVRSKPLGGPNWGPQYYDGKEQRQLEEVLESRNPFRFSNPLDKSKVALFENEYAARMQTKYANANVGSPKGPSLRVPVISKPRRNSSEGHLVMTKP